jgi:hypothetical protein
MFCPRCSQEQASAEIRFCSRCGLPLADVAEAVEGGGFVDRSAGDAACSLRRSVFASLFMMAASFIFLIVSLIMGTPEPSFVVQWNLVVSLAFFFSGLIWAGYTLRPRKKKTQPRQQQQIVKEPTAILSIEGYAAPTHALPDSYSTPAVVRTTRELDKIPSVTEHTTRTLGK